MADGSPIGRRAVMRAERFIAFKKVQWLMAYLIKSSGMRELFNDQRLLAASNRSLQKHLVSITPEAHKLKSKSRATVDGSIARPWLGN